MTAEWIAQSPASQPEASRTSGAAGWPSQLVRSLTADETVEVRAALVARGAWLAHELAGGVADGARVERLRTSKHAVDGLLAQLDALRIEV
ncbi:hypothetical protein L332_03405 [Agrococcus pavilionensis RW1]|uniref:Uncharacterized protein n=1 Tax=Agrococcus pavilionensis RW1 TaxID=1330458 RepID=U1LNG0_9MICO|nr:hypothetical protein [Agrococcus pavilionensis]ERG63502.1 hypothetical protein L332_03405 [Agrococcus pavilionensis RW1]